MLLVFSPHVIGHRFTAGVDEQAITDPEYMRKQLYRPVGIGAIWRCYCGYCVGVAADCKRHSQYARRSQSGAALSKDEMPIKLLYLAIGGAAILLVVMAILSTEKWALDALLLLWLSRAHYGSGSRVLFFLNVLGALIGRRSPV